MQYRLDFLTAKYLTKLQTFDNLLKLRGHRVGNLK